MNKSLIVSGSALAAAMTATPALAHTVEGAASGFAAGFIHPLSGTDHLLAILAVGIWSVLAGDRSAPGRVWLAPLAFLAAMAAGAFIAVAGIALPMVETGIAVSVMLLGLLVASRVRFAVPMALSVVALFALFHGHAHGSEASGAFATYMTGFSLCAGMLLLAGLGLGRVLAQTRYLAALVGSAVAASGALMVAV